MPEPPGDPTPWKSMYILKENEKQALRRTTDLSYFVRAICMDFRERHAVYAAGTTHNTTTMGRDDTVRWVDMLDEKGWMWRLSVRKSKLDPSMLLDYLDEFGIMVTDLTMNNPNNADLHCFIRAKDFPLLLMYRRMGGLDGEPGRTRWSVERKIILAD